MRRDLRRAIPSMFHRRLLLLGTAAVGITSVLALQTGRLTLGAEHDLRRAEAEAALREQELIPTVRGRILDRRGRVLAVDDPGWEVAVKYTVITGEWAYEMGVRDARSKHRRAWSEMDAGARAAAIDEAMRPYADQVEMLWGTLSELTGASRGEVDERKQLIKARIQATASALWDKWQKERARQLNEDVPLADVMRPIREQREAHGVIPNVGEAERVAIQGFVAEAARNRNMPGEATVANGGGVNPMAVWSQVELRRPQRRAYPLEKITLELDRTMMPSPLRSETPLEVTVEGVGTHILGAMRDVWEEDVKRRPFLRGQEEGLPDLGGYRPGDRAGSWGVERSLEGSLLYPGLRGTLGVVVRHRDSGYEERLEPQPGRDATLTIDAQLQARVQAILTPHPSPEWTGLMVSQPWHGGNVAEKGLVGKRLNGAAVVMEIESGEVLAAVSMPAMSRALLEKEPKRLFEDVENLPWLNRVVARPYMPGSTIKPIMLAAAVTAGRHDLSHPIDCKGLFDPNNPDSMKCWIFKRFAHTHGPLDAPSAVEQSCNIYFYELGQRMGLQRTIEWYGKFGMGTPTDCGLGLASDKTGDEVSGALGKANPERNDSVFMGIGQGPVSWTPIQAANAYGILARGGALLPPTLVRDESRTTPRETGELRLNRESVRQAMQGLLLSANEADGTTHHLSMLDKERIFNVPGVTVMAKSGTADPGHRWIDYDRDGKPSDGEVDKDPGDHAWCAAYVQPDGEDGPTHVVVVIVEYAGSGGQVGGPIANQVIHAMAQEGVFAPGY